MTRRGDTLRDHILWVAKDVFLQTGYERASMDVIASQAGASKRSLYAFFESKEKLFLAVVALVQELFLSCIKEPGAYSDNPAEALVIFCGRYLETLTYQSQIRMLRSSMAEAERFPEQAQQYFDLISTQMQARLSAYLKVTYGLSPRASMEAAGSMLGQILYTRFLRILLGADPPTESLDPEVLSPVFDLRSVRKVVSTIIKSFET